MAWIVMFLVLLGAVVGYLSLMATVGILRTDTLTKPQKLAQISIAWLIPIVGARLVVHLLSEQDIEAIPQRWMPNDTMNYYVLSSLGVPAQAMTRFASRVIQNEIYETIAERVSSASSEPASGGTSSSGGDAGGSGD